MVEAHESSTPLLDEWIAETGEQAVVDIVEDTQRRAAEGTLPAFTKAADLAAHLRQQRRQTA